MEPKTKEELDNHSNQLNPNNDAYWQSRGDDGMPDDDDDDDSPDSDYDQNDLPDDNESFFEEWVPQDGW
jgi:hypothetical protein